MVITLILRAAQARVFGRFEEAKRDAEEALELARHKEDVFGTAWSTLTLGVVAQLEGRYESAKELCTESAELYRQQGGQWGTAWSLLVLGTAARHLGALGEAGAYFRESLGITSRIGQQAGIVQALHGLAGVALDRGNREGAARLLGLPTMCQKLLASKSLFHPLRSRHETRAPLGQLWATKGSRRRRPRAASWKCEKSLSIRTSHAKCGTDTESAIVRIDELDDHTRRTPLAPLGARRTLTSGAHGERPSSRSHDLPHAGLSYKRPIKLRIGQSQQPGSQHWTRP